VSTASRAAPQHAAPPGVREAVALGLTAAEYELICAKQARPPNALELAMFSLLWSEHCAYKHSRRLLRTLPTHGSNVVMGPGENAGAVELPGGLVCAFKVESHNHPSAVEPFQGAATGVGGIVRDIFAIGARPIALLDSLRFGEPASARARYLLDEAVSGIAHYGNSIGVPTVGGEVYFEDAYEHACLINVMAVGLARRDQLVRSAAAGTGNLLVLLGAATGRDGIGGASVLASSELAGSGGTGARGDEDGGGEAGAGDAGDAAGRDMRPTVQVGDPFAEKKLLECTLALLDAGLIVALQDLGAAGLTSAVAEMAAKGGVGVEIDVAKVPLREPGMEPWEVMVSESQERMLCLVAPDDVPRVLACADRWEIGAAPIGRVTDDTTVRVLADQRLAGEMSVAALVDECPLYELAPQRPSGPPYRPAPAQLGRDCDPRQALLALLASPNISSRRALFEQYDCIVQSRTVRRPEQADAAVLALDDGSAIALSIDCNGRRVGADPRRGTVEAVLECAANLACVGAQPLGVTNNLNFANPEKPHVAWQLSESVRGLAEACSALSLPVVGGNVSLYNESRAGPIYPTPVIGMVGQVPDARQAGRAGFSRAGDQVALVGPFAPSLAASELAKLQGLPLPDGLPGLAVDGVIAAHEAVREAVRAGALASAHDVAEGGLAVALAECCLAGGVGASIELPDSLLGEGGAASGSALRALFGEGPGGFVVSGAADALAQLARKVCVVALGRVGGKELLLAAAGAELRVTLAELRRSHSALGGLFA
jgi:phosphoribosylformylglycinamidine synthase II